MLQLLSPLVSRLIVYRPDSHKQLQRKLQIIGGPDESHLNHMYKSQLQQWGIKLLPHESLC